MAAARAATAGVSSAGLLGLTAWALAWAFVVGGGYWTVRVRRV